MVLKPGHIQLAGRMLNAADEGVKWGQRINRLRSFMKNRKTRSRRSNDFGVTVQHDVNNQYRKRRMPRRKVRKWKRFVKKVEAVSQRLKHLRSVVLNSEASGFLNSAQQTFVACHLYGGSGVAESVLIPQETGQRDLYRISQSDGEVKAIAGKSTAAKLHFASATIDLTFTNASDITMEVDVYKIIYGFNEKDMNCFTQCVASGEQYSGPLATSALQIDERGVTPFSLGGLISAGKMKILWKRKYLLSSGQSATLQHRDPKNRWVYVNDLTSNSEGDPSVSDFTYKKYTVTFLFIAKFTNAATEQTGSLVVRSTRSYNYKVEMRDQNTFLGEYITY